MHSWMHEFEAILLILAVSVLVYRLATSKEDFFSILIDKFKDNQQAFLTVATTMLFGGCVLLLFFKDFPPTSEKVLTLLTGTLAAKWGDVMAYQFNSSAGSAKKTDLMAANSAKKDGE